MAVVAEILVAVMVLLEALAEAAVMRVVQLLELLEIRHQLVHLRAATVAMVTIVLEILLAAAVVARLLLALTLFLLLAGMVALEQHQALAAAA